MGSIRKFVDLEDHLKSAMRDWSLNQDLDNQAPQKEDLGRRHKLANEQVHRRLGAQSAIPGKYMSEEERKLLEDEIKAKVLPESRSQKKLTEGN